MSLVYHILNQSRLISSIKLVQSHRNRQRPHATLKNLLINLIQSAIDLKYFAVSGNVLFTCTHNVLFTWLPNNAVFDWSTFLSDYKTDGDWIVKRRRQEENNCSFWLTKLFRAKQVFIAYRTEDIAKNQKFLRHLMEKPGR